MTGKKNCLILKSMQLAYNKKDVNYYFQWTWILRRIGESDLAKEFMLQAHKIVPDDIIVAANLSWMHRDPLGFEEQKDLNKALDYAFQAYALDSNSHLTLDHMGWSHFEMGDLDNAEKYWRKILEAEKNFGDTSAHYPFRHRVGHVLWLKGQKEEAKKWFQESIRTNLQDVEKLNFIWGPAFHDLAVVNAFLGNKEEAYHWLEESAKRSQGQGWNRYWVQTDTMFHTIRHEERFQTLVQNRNKREELADDAFKRALAKMEASEELKFRLSQ